LKVLSLFSGIGAFEKALTRLNIEYELVNYCEIDKYAAKAYSLIHNISEELNLGDITKINEKKLSDFDLMTWGFPCTDISIAGKQEGFIDKNGNKTRSGLYYEGLRILKYKKPKYSIIENVKNLTSKKFKKQFEQILSDLENEGYNSYWQVLNAKDYGVPQNRERVFIVSIRKDIDDGRFEFPKGFDNGIRLKDLLENSPSDKYLVGIKTHIYLDKHKEIHKNKGNGFGYSIKNIHNDIAFSITTKITACRSSDNYIAVGDRIRRLTPLECFRLMGFDDRDYYILKENKLSDTQIYKMAGNSIVVNVIEAIFNIILK